MSDAIRDPHASGLDHGLTSALHSPNPQPAPKKTVDVPFTPEDVRRKAAAETFAKYHAEHGAYGGVSREFHLRAETWILDAAREIATLRAELERQRTNNRHGREECGKLHARIEGMRETGRAQIAETQALRAEVARLASQLAECYRLTGADPDGDSDAMLAKHAVAEVRQLREESDAEIEQLESERNRLAGIVRAVIEATGTDPDAVDLRHVVAAELAEHVASLREPNVAADLRTQALAADSSRLRAAVEEATSGALHVCHAIEALPAGEAQTRASVMASELRVHLTAALSPAPAPEEAAKHSIDECPACGYWMPEFDGEVFDGAAAKCPGCGAEVEAHVRDGRAFTTATPTPPEEARGEEKCGEENPWYTRNRCALPRDHDGPHDSTGSAPAPEKASEA